VHLRATALAAAVALLALGCGTEGSERDARGAVERFYAAFERGDGAGACVELSEQASSALEASAAKPCEQAVQELELSPSAVGDVEVYETSAQASLQGGDTVFLDQTDAGWKISAAACEATPGQPYECQLEA
jgi:hypothetical protein